MRLVYQKKSYWVGLLAVLFLLTACNQENSASTNASSEQNSSSQTSMTESSSTAETTTSSQSSSQESTAPSEENTSETVPSPSTSSSAPVNKTESNYIPAILVGEWVGSTPQAERISITISGNGLVTSTATFHNGDTAEWRAIINSFDAVGNETYFITSYSGDYNALLPGSTGFGGAGSKIAFGFRIENAQLIPVNWIIPEDESTFNYENIHTFGYALSHR